MKCKNCGRPVQHYRGERWTHSGNGFALCNLMDESDNRVAELLLKADA
jgi:hypothetical protein